MRKPWRSIDETIVSLGQRQMIDRLVDRCPVEVGRPIAAYRILSSRVTRAREKEKKKERRHYTGGVTVPGGNSLELYRVNNDRSTRSRRMDRRTPHTRIRTRTHSSFTLFAARKSSSIRLADFSSPPRRTINNFASVRRFKRLDIFTSVYLPVYPYIIELMVLIITRMTVGHLSAEWRDNGKKEKDMSYIRRVY